METTRRKPGRKAMDPETRRRFAQTRRTSFALPEAMYERIEHRLQPAESVSEFIRRAIDRELGEPSVPAATS